MNEIAASPRVIKRYANRKLYDTLESRYVTLQDIAEFVRVGQNVQIIDNKSKEDLTRVTLAQIIYEEERNGDERRTLTSLRSFVQEGRDRIVNTFMDGPMGKLVRRDEEEPTRPSEPPPAKPVPVPPAGERLDRKLMANSKEALDELQRKADDRVKSIVQSAMGTVQQLQTEVRRLQSRIEELEDRLVSVTRRSKDGEGGRPAHEDDDLDPDADSES
ncbi:MAG: polyhydroxyalkanoate synthesis regulator DNA-binding domain-containing protein [Polyangiales bacterium]